MRIYRTIIMTPKITGSKMTAPTQGLKVIDKQGIKTIDKYGTNWVYKTAKTENMPSRIAIDRAIEKKHQIIVSRQVDKNRMYSSYQSPEDVIDTIREYGNIHLYEMIREDQPVNLFFDIEFPANELDIKSALISLISFTKQIMCETFGHMETFDNEDIQVSGSVGDGKIENVEVRKASYHIVIQCNSTFRCMADLKHFMNYFRFKLDELNPDNMFYMLKGNLKRIVDFQVYGRNQNMKLPYQSKYGSDRVQAPIINHDNLLNHLCGNYEDIEYLDFFDISRIPEFEPEQRTKTQRKALGGARDYISSGNIHADFVPRECIPEDGQPSYNIEYIIKSIDNTDQDYNVWFGVACALKNYSDKDMDTLPFFLQWAGKSSKYNETECRKLWDRLERREKGYNFGTLISLAKRCNPKLEELKKNEDYITPLVSIDIPFNKTIYNERWQRPYDLDRHSTIIAQSPMGSGKTTQICETIKNLGYDMRVLVLAPRRCFAKSIATEITKKSGIPFTCYLDVDKKADLCKEQYLVCQMESIHYLKSNYNMIIADEITSCLTQFSSSQTMKGKLGLVSEAFEAIWNKAEYKIVSDAFINPKVIQFIKNFEYRKQPPTIDVAFTGYDPYAHVLFMKNEYIPEERTCVDLTYVEHGLFNQLLLSLKAGKKCVFVSASRQKGMECLTNIKQLIPDIKYKFYHSQNKDDADDLLNVNEHWLGLDLLIYTSSITVGVNFDIEYFDELYMYSSCKSSGVRDNFQSSMRCRYIKDKIMYYSLFDRPFGIDKREVVDDIDSVAEVIKRKAELEDRLEETIGAEGEPDRMYWKEMPRWLFDIHVSNTYEQNVSTLHHRELFQYYLGVCGYVHMDYEANKEVCIPAFYDEITFLPYNEIHYTYYDIEKLEVKNKIDRENLTDYERLQWNKIMFDRQIMDVEHRGDIFDHFFNPENHSKNKFYNCLYEKRYTLTDMSKKERSEQIYKEMTSKKTMRLKTIREVIDVLGIVSSTSVSQTFDSEFLLSKYDIVMSKKAEWLEAFGLRDRCNGKATELRQLIYVMNAILEKWSGSKIKLSKRRHKRINGERVYISDYTIFPPIPIDICGSFSD